MNMDNQRRSLSHQFATVGDLSRRVRRNRATLLSSLVQDEDAEYEHNNRLNNRNIDDDDDDDRHLPLSVMLRKFNLEHGYVTRSKLQAIIGPSSEDNDSNGDNDALRPNNTQSDGVEENAYNISNSLLSWRKTVRLDSSSSDRSRMNIDNF